MDKSEYGVPYDTKIIFSDEASWSRIDITGRVLT